MRREQQPSTQTPLHATTQQREEQPSSSPNPAHSLHTRCPSTLLCMQGSLYAGGCEVLEGKGQSPAACARHAHSRRPRSMQTYHVPLAPAGNWRVLYSLRIARVAQPQVVAHRPLDSLHDAAWRMMARLTASLAVLAVGLLLAAAAAPAAVPLPDGAQPEGVAAGAPGELWVACLSGRVVHVDLGRNVSTVVHQESNVALSGAKYCASQQLLFAAGSLSGRAYLFHMRRASAAQQPYRHMLVRREVVQLAPALRPSYINDVALSSDRAYFTDSFNAMLYSIPRTAPAAAGTSSSSSSRQREVLQHPTGRFFNTQLGQFRANGLAVYETTQQRDTLLVANTHTGNLYSVVLDKPSPRQQQAWPAPVVTELALPDSPGPVTRRLLLDGVWVANASLAFVADNYNNRVWGVALGAGLASARLSCVMRSPAFAVPTTLTEQGGALWAVNAHLDSCFPFLPCPRHKFELLALRPSGDCVPLLPAPAPAGRQLTAMMGEMTRTATQWHG